LLQPEFYQSLINRGWRRSGCLLYKGNQRISCCPQYTIRLDSGFFRASKDQRQALNRFNKYILGELYIKEAARQYPKSRDQAKKRDTDFDLLERIHESEKVFVQTPPEPSHALSVTLESDNFTEEKFSLYENYQRIVHHEPSHRITRSGFKNFLCSSPIPRKTETLDGRERRLGSYHQCYRVYASNLYFVLPEDTFHITLLPRCHEITYMYLQVF
jgi:arginine-tRNA-protein transferase